MVRIKLQAFGYPAVHRDGEPVEIPLRKGLALLVLVAVSGKPQSRDAIVEMLWPHAEPGVGRTRLRRTLHKLHGMIGAKIIAADRHKIALDPSVTFQHDVRAFTSACDAHDFTTAIDLYSGEFLLDFELDDCPGFGDWAFYQREALRSRFINALERSVEEHLAAGKHAAAIELATRRIHMDPLDESAHRLLISAHVRAGKNRAAERLVHAYEVMVRNELGVEPDPTLRKMLALPLVADEPPPTTRYSQGNGIHLAYQITGRGPRDIMLVPGFVSHVERAWDDRDCAAFLRELAGLGRLITFDRRGVGLSDRVGAAPTIESTADDIATLLDAAGAKRVLLIGVSEGGPSAIRFAHANANRLSGLILYGSLAKGCWSSAHPFALKRRQYDAWLNRLIAQWGGPAEIEVFAPSVAKDPRVAGWWANLLRSASSPGTIRAVLEALRDADVRACLPEICVPTLVLHRRGDMAVRFEAGRFLAEKIPGARFAALDGSDHWIWAGDQAPVFEQIRRFIRTTK